MKTQEGRLVDEMMLWCLEHYLLVFCFFVYFFYEKDHHSFYCILFFIVKIKIISNSALIEEWNGSNNFCYINGVRCVCFRSR